MNLEQAIERCEDFSRGLACARHQGLGQALTLVLAAAKEHIEGLRICEAVLGLSNGPHNPSCCSTCGAPVRWRYALGDGERRELRGLLHWISMPQPLGGQGAPQEIEALTAALNLAAAPSVLSEGSRKALEGLYERLGGEDDRADEREALVEALSLSPPKSSDHAWKCRGCGVVSLGPLTDDTTCQCDDLYAQDWVRLEEPKVMPFSPPFTREELETLRGFACCADQRWEWDEREAALAAKLDAYLESLPEDATDGRG